ncbi:MAG TPA: hypothetical protein VN845_05755, partial [Solirubrobacteraceae bacterium]|nr:hypothetical protein [Solirubrobacteraceae bacterium]
MPKTVILGSARTPIGKMGGGLSTLDATELGAIAIEAALERSAVEPEQVEHVVMGQVLQAGQGQIPSRQAQIKAGVPKEVSSETVNKVCASGLRASVIIDQAIRAGDMQVGVGGGERGEAAAHLADGGAGGAEDHGLGHCLRTLLGSGCNDYRPAMLVDAFLAGRILCADRERLLDSRPARGNRGRHRRRRPVRGR